MRTESPIFDPTWTVSEIGLEDLVLAYLGQSAAAARTGRLRSRRRKARHDLAHVASIPSAGPRCVRCLRRPRSCPGLHRAASRAPVPRQRDPGVPSEPWRLRPARRQLHFSLPVLAWTRPPDHRDPRADWTVLGCAAAGPRARDRHVSGGVDPECDSDRWLATKW